MLAVLTAVGVAVRAAMATKNVLGAVMNAAAVVVFLFAPGLDAKAALVLAAGALVGGQLGVWLLRRVNETALRLFVVLVGSALTVGLFLRGP